MTEHKCPYNGLAHDDDWTWLCGTHGFLCDRCKEDRADARSAALTGALLHLTETIHVSAAGQLPQVHR
jgi:hypothetical protein